MNFLCATYGSFHSVFSRSENQFCSAGLEKGSSFKTHAFRHGEDESETVESGNQCKSDACIAGGRFDNGAAAGDEPSVKSVLNHAQGCTILD